MWTCRVSGPVLNCIPFHSVPRNCNTAGPRLAMSDSRELPSRQSLHWWLFYFVRMAILEANDGLWCFLFWIDLEKFATKWASTGGIITAAFASFPLHYFLLYNNHSPATVTEIVFCKSFVVPYSFWTPMPQFQTPVSETLTSKIWIPHWPCDKLSPWYFHPSLTKSGCGLYLIEHDVTLKMLTFVCHVPCSVGMLEPTVINGCFDKTV